MSLVNVVKQRLKAETSLRMVDGALELAAALKAPSVATPAAFVVPMADRPGADAAFSGSVLQAVETTLSIVLVLDNKRDSTGSAANDELERLRGEIRKALLGWAPDGVDSPLTAGRGQLIDLDNGRVWWGDEFRIEHYWSSK